MKIKYILSFFLLTLFFQVNAQEKKKDTTKDDIDHRFYIKNLAINNKFYNFGTDFYGDNQIVFSSQQSKDDFYDLYIGTISKDGEIVNVHKIEAASGSKKTFRSNVDFTNGFIFSTN